MRKKVLWSILFCLLLSLATVAFSQKEAKAQEQGPPVEAQWTGGGKGYCGEDIMFAIDGRTIYLRGTGKTSDYTPDDALWRDLFCYDMISRVVVGEGITGIGNYFFYRKEASIPNSTITFVLPASLKSIASTAFQNTDPNLSQIFFYGSQTAWDTFSFTNKDKIPATCLNTALPAITTEPKNAHAAIGQSATFSVKATGYGLSYQWYYNKDGLGWEPWKDGNSRTLSVKADGTRNGWKFYCEVKDAAGTRVLSNTVSFTEDVTVTTQPKSQSGYIGDSVKLSLKVKGGMAPYQYKWETSSNGGATWGKYSSQKEPEITIKSSLNGRLFRCVVTDANGKSVTSNTLKITVKTKITTQPAFRSGKVGKVVELSVSASGAGLKYQWYTSKDDGATWSKYSAKQTLKITLKDSLNGRLFRCEITDANGKKVTSRVVSLAVKQ